MRKLGVIGGLSWAATERYYRLINSAVQAQVGGMCSAPLVIDSLNPCDLLRREGDDGLDQIRARLTESARQLVAAGAQGLIIAANSMHVVADDVADAAGVPLLHIIDATGAAMRARGIKSAAVIGTHNVMTQRWYRQRLVGEGVTLAPYDAARAAEIDRIVYDELMHGEVREDSRRTMRTFLTNIAKQDIDAVVLACTELTMLVDPDANVVPIVDTTRVHAQAAADWILNAG